MLYILEMLCDSLCDTDLTDGDTQGLHQLDGIVVGAIGGAETWHCDTDDTFTVQVKFIEGFDGYKQSQRGIETATDADNRFLGVDMIKALCKTCHLNIENLLTGRLHILVFGNKRMGIDRTLQYKVSWLYWFTSNLHSMRMALGIDVGGVLATLYAQLLDVDLTLLYLWRETETISFHQQLSVLENHGIATIDHILRGLTETTAGIYIAADGTGTLLSQQGLEIGMLTNELVAGREVEDDIGTRERQIVAGRNRCPHIFADLNAKLHTIGSDKDLGFCTDGNSVTCINACDGVHILS